MSARRFFARALPAAGGEVRLDAGAARHARVLRLREGDAVVLFDGSGAEAEGHVASIGDEVRCVVGPPRAGAAPGPSVVLCQCLPKGSKLDDIVRASTELGVRAIHLVSSERAVARPDPARAEKRLERLAAVAREAARQSGRADVPDLLAPAPLDEVLARAPEGAARIAFAPGGEGTLASAVGEARLAWVLIGPEGGLAPAELALAARIGFAVVGLGRTVLRVETAAPVALALVLHRMGGLAPG
ncbi:MAG TPA: RsmE family RNA methyltransferase [Sandaracinaceae bacterium]